MDKLSKKGKVKFRPSLKAAVQVADLVQLNEVRILGCECTQKIRNLSGNKCIDMDRNAKVEIDKDNKRIFVIADFVLRAFLENEQNDPFAVVKATLLLVYESQHNLEMPIENFNSFAQTNGVYNAWPYWREFVQSMTTRMGLPPLTIPVFRIVKPSDQKPSQSKTEVAKTTKKVKSKAVKKKTGAE